MFVGHYGPAYAGKALDRTIPLWVLFLAVQLLDVIWGPLVLLGVEHVRIDPTLASSPLDLYDMPYTHSLPAAVAWAIVAAVAWRAMARSPSWRGPMIVGAAVFSHWILDFVDHRHDLALWGDRFKVGLGLWDYPMAALSLEAIVLFAGTWLYVRGGAPRPRATILISVVLMGVQAVSYWAPPPASPNAVASSAFVAYLVFAGVAWWLDRPLAARPSANSGTHS